MPPCARVLSPVSTLSWSQKTSESAFVQCRSGNDRSVKETIVAMNESAISIHEASHAVAGVCLGRLGLLKKVSIVATPEMKGGCHWDVVKGKCPPDQQGQEIGILLAGPIGQVLYAQESLGKHAMLFQDTVFQSEAILEESGCAGWVSTDLNAFIAIRRRGWPLDIFTKVETPLKLLLSRYSVGSAICKLASCLESFGEVEGAEAEQIILLHLAPDDIVGKDYFN